MGNGSSLKVTACGHAKVVVQSAQVGQWGRYGYSGVAQSG